MGKKKAAEKNYEVKVLWERAWGAKAVMMLLCSLQGKRRWISQVGIVNAGEYFNEQNVYIVEFVKRVVGGKLPYSFQLRQSDVIFWRRGSLGRVGVYVAEEELVMSLRSFGRERSS